MNIGDLVIYGNSLWEIIDVIGSKLNLEDINTGDVEKGVHISQVAYFM